MEKSVRKGSLARRLLVLACASAASCLSWLVLDPAAGAPHEGIRLGPLVLLLAVAAFVGAFALAGYAESIALGLVAPALLLSILPYYPGMGLWILAIPLWAVILAILVPLGRLGVRLRRRTRW